MDPSDDYVSIDERLSDADLALTNVASDPTLSEPLAEFGYNRERLTEGRTLLDAAIAAHDAVKNEYRDQYDASDDYRAAYAPAQRAYMQNLRLARAAFRNDRGAAEALGLDGRRKKVTGEWIQQVRRFYDGLGASAPYQATAARLGLSAARRTTGRTLFDAVVQTNTVHEREKGEAQRATDARDPIVDALDEWMDDFHTVAEVAFADDPQQLEKLGRRTPSA